MSITKTVKLDYCWVCGGREGLHDHHVVPQSYGGTNGPTVTLCGAHHTFIHATALKKRSNWVFAGPPEQRARLEYLVTVIDRARRAVKHLTRPMLVSHKLDVTRAEKLRAIKKLARLSSLTKALEYAIDVAYARHTPLK